MNRSVGPRALPVYNKLRDHILSGDLQPGAQLPSHMALSQTFGVALMTVRQALARLEDEGLVTCDHGRGTFVRGRGPAVLVVDDEESARNLLRNIVEGAGHRVVEASNPAEALEQLNGDKDIVLALTDVRMPDKKVGLDFIRTLRREWSSLPVAVLTAFPDDVAELHGEPEWPTMIVPKPFRVSQVEEVLRLAVKVPSVEHVTGDLVLAGVG